MSVDLSTCMYAAIMTWPSRLSFGELVRYLLAVCAINVRLSLALQAVKLQRACASSTLLLSSFNSSPFRSPAYSFQW